MVTNRVVFYIEESYLMQIDEIARTLQSRGLKNIMAESLNGTITGTFDTGSAVDGVFVLIELRNVEGIKTAATLNRLHKRYLDLRF